MKRLPKPPKAYKDLEFLNSPDARTVRILSEFLEPYRRFRRANIRDTIVFFGSARIRPRPEALKRLREVQARLERSRRPNKRMLQEFRSAERAVEMSRYYEEAAELARLLSRWSRSMKDPYRFVICSGGGPGIMEAANRGAIQGGGRSIGLNISLPFEQFANPYITPGLNFEFHYFFMRKFWFAYLSKALVAFPGGFGTLDELMEILTLRQTKKITKDLAVVLYGSDYWSKVLDFRELVNNGMISREDLSLFKVLDTPQEAFEYLKRFLDEHYVRRARSMGK
jgi:uncharacterized protein (TIGR00730 family)